MKIKKGLPFLLTIALAGCVPVMSLHPLYDDKTLVFEEKLLGTFVDDDDATWDFARAEDPNTYTLTYIKAEEQKVLKGLFVVRIAKLDSRLFLDVYPKEPPWADEASRRKTKWFYNSVFMIPAHTFIKIEAIEPKLELYFADTDDLKKLLKKNPDAVKHEIVDDSPVLTGSTKMLQSFVIKYANDDQLFTRQSTLTRKVTEPAPDANEKPI